MEEMLINEEHGRLLMESKERLEEIEGGARL